MTNRQPKLTLIAALCLMMVFIIAQPAHGQTNEEKFAAANKAFDEAIALRKKGTVESLQAAREKIREAIALFHAAGDKSGDAGGFYMLGEISSQLGENQKALDYYNQALPFLRETGNKEQETMVLMGIALAYNALGEKRKAIDFYQQVLSFFQSIGDKKNEVISLSVIAHWLDDLSEKRESLEYYEKTLSLYRLLNDKTGEANTLANLGLIYALVGQKQKELDSFNQAQFIFQSTGDKEGEADLLLRVGTFYSSIGELQKSLDYSNKALSLYRAISKKEGEATALIAIGAVYSSFGEYQKALENYNNSLPLVRSLNQKQGEAGIFNQIGLVYSALGETQKALESFQEAMQIFSTTIGNKEIEATILNNIGTAYSDLGENEKAINYFNKALELSQIIGKKRMEATTLSNIGSRYLDKPQVSLKYFAQSLQIFRAVQDKSSEASTLNNIGFVYFSSNEYSKALESLNQSLILSRAIGDKKSQAMALVTFAAIWDKQKNPRFAVFYGKQAINVYQQIRANIKGLDKETQKTYLKSIEPAYRGLADFLIQNSHLAEAQQVLNLFKDQQFFDFNNTKQSDPPVLTEREAATISAFDKKLETIGAFSRQIDELRRNIGNREPTVTENAELKRLETDLQKAKDDYLAFLKFAEKDFAAPPDDKDKFPDVADLREMQTALKELSAQTGEKSVAVYTLVGADNYRALVVTSDSIFDVSTPIKDAVLNQKAQQLWRLLRTPEYDPQPLAREIYNVVFAPLAAKLPADTKTILWSLDGNLRYLPMAALHDGRRYLVERYNNVVFTRADKERLTRSVSANLTGTGLGGSEAHTVKLGGESFNAGALPFVKTELARIFKTGDSTTGVLTGEVLLDARFTRSAMISTLQKRRPLVHIASHFKFEPGDEANSFLLLGDGSPFTLDEMKRQKDLFAGVELLALSACETAAQREGNGREVDGFAELAQRLGAGAVMASLWEVADNSTAELMARFYKTYNSQSGANKATSLRSAQLALLRGEYKTAGAANRELKREDAGISTIIKIEGAKLKPFKVAKTAPFAHPFYWSPFILIGNWK